MGGTSINANLKSSWYARDVFYIFLLYFLIYSFFLYLEAKIFGEWVLEDKNLPSSFLFFEDTIDAIIITILPIFFVTKVYTANLQEIGLTLKDFKKNLFAGLIVSFFLWVVLSICDIGIESLWGKGPDHPYIQKLETSNNLISYLAVMSSIAILAPISEEIYFRGFAYTVFKKRYGKTIGIILSSFLFAAMHFHLLWLFQFFLLGIVLSLLFDYTKSVVSVIVAHSGINLLAVYLGNV